MTKSFLSPSVDVWAWCDKSNTGRRPPASDRLIWASANSLIITADSTFDDKGATTVEERLNWNTEMQRLDLDLRRCESLFFFFTPPCVLSNQGSTTNEKRQSKFLLSLLLISQDTVFLMSHFTRDSIPTSLNKTGFDPSPLPFIFCLKYMAANSGSWCSICGESKWTNVT